MIDRLYDNGMLNSGEAQHYNSWDYPTMPRLAKQGAVSRRLPIRKVQSRKRGYLTRLFYVLRAR